MADKQVIMTPKTTPTWLSCILLLLVLAACAHEEPEATQTLIASASATNTAVPATTAPADTPVPTPAIRPATPTATFTTISLPLPPLAPFPTVTPDHRVYPTKPIFLSFGSSGGDGGRQNDDYYGRGTPTLIIYGDGQFLLREGSLWESTITFMEATVTPAEMCAIKQQIAATGFLEPHETHFTERTDLMGAGSLTIQVEETYYSFDYSDVPFLVPDLAQGVELIQNYRPPGTLSPYTPEYLLLWIEQGPAAGTETAEPWPADLPPLEELWTDRNQNEILIEGDSVIPIFELFSHQLAEKVFQEGDATYRIIARPLLPHETPYYFSLPTGFPRDYIPVLTCEGEPSLISPAIPTATPTLTSPAAALSGQGRIAFVSIDLNDHEIYVSDADGTHRFQITNNLYQDIEPTWSPDGQRIAFVSNRTGNRDIFVMDTDGRNVTQLTDNLEEDYSPSWSPDGTKIAFISNRDGGWEKSNIYLMLSSGAEEVRLTNNDNGRSWYPVWSPDGRKIAFVNKSDSGAERIAVYDLDSGEITPLTAFSSHFLSRPAWSPDGAFIVTALDPGEEAFFQRISLESHAVEEIPIPNLDIPKDLDWSADGRFILFSAGQPNGIHYSEDQTQLISWNLYALDTTTNQIIQITYNQEFELYPSWWP